MGDTFDLRLAVAHCVDTDPLCALWMYEATRLTKIDVRVELTKYHQVESLNYFGLQS